MYKSAHERHKILLQVSDWAKPYGFALKDRIEHMADFVKKDEAVHLKIELEFELASGDEFQIALRDYSTATYCDGGGYTGWLGVNTLWRFDKMISESLFEELMKHFDVKRVTPS
jgi:hypothetical protein